MTAAFELQVEGGQARRGVTYVVTLKCRVRGRAGEIRCMATGELLLDAAALHQSLQQACRDHAREPDLEVISAVAVEHPTHLDVTSLGDAP